VDGQAPGGAGGPHSHTWTQPRSSDPDTGFLFVSRQSSDGLRLAALRRGGSGAFASERARSKPRYGGLADGKAPRNVCLGFALRQSLKGLGALVGGHRAGACRNARPWPSHGFCPRLYRQGIGRARTRPGRRGSTLASSGRSALAHYCTRPADGDGLVGAPSCTRTAAPRCSPRRNRARMSADGQSLVSSAPKPHTGI
jgi:hypothetical protein